MLDRKGVGKRGVYITIIILGINLNIIPIYVYIYFRGFLIEFLLTLLLEGVFLSRYYLIRLENYLSYKTSAYRILKRKD